MIDNNKCASWAGNDFYFSMGLTGLRDELRSVHDLDNFLFVNLNGFTLKYFIECFDKIDSSHIVIISSQRLLPLSYYWLNFNYRVCAVFESSSSLKAIADGLRYLQVRRIPLIHDSLPNYHLSSLDVSILKNYLQEESMTRIQEKLSLGYGNLSAKKVALASKLGVKRLEHLLINF